MELKIFKLYFSGPLHISGPKDDYGKSETKYHSDSLYAALIAALSQLHTGFEPVAESGDLGCTISSLFPFTKDKDGKEVFFLPKPFVPYNAGDLTNIAKKVKKAKWLDADYYSKVLRNEYLGLLGKTRNNNEAGADLKGEYLSSRRIDEDFFSSYTVPRIRVPRSGADNDGNTEIFYMERLMFKNGSGLYFIADGDTTRLEEALDLLQYDGIGTDRNVGQGQFRYEMGSIELDVPNRGNKMVALSLFCPEDEEQLNDMLGENAGDSSYEIINRGGWVSSPGLGKVRKRSVYMFMEGSIFQVLDDQTSNYPISLGKIDIDLSPWNDLADGKIPIQELHKIFRSGRALFLPLETN